ncbi:tRNA uridine(34) 5-carboxymethylaminomethyl modification radical SAM/GNAT enzyme Elp3 [Candidatus Woesearchaeota archaeon]|nr:tRNA uridine(34) 5-carboxymethylaminomethyl modification radical SAM/GNAT enzyme Elp3 [Candidatus Woesearchaeota archaeon]
MASLVQDLLVELGRGNITGQKDLAVLKQRLVKRHNLRKVPSNIELAALLSGKEREKYRHVLTLKPVRNVSGVEVVAIMGKPINCQHGRCIYCPGGVNSFFGDVPQSYTGNEPATMRAIRNSYDSYLQVMNRLEQYVAINKAPKKIELIIMGGTFPSFPYEYQDEFITYAFKALNDFGDRFLTSEEKLRAFMEFFELPHDVKDPAWASRIQERILSMRGTSHLEAEQLRNETNPVRCVALVFETRPDFAGPREIDQMLRLGATRVEVGIQSLYEDVIQKAGRCHTLEQSRLAARQLKDAFFKTGFHMMPGLPHSTKEMDIAMLKELFDNPDWRPDALKIYPTMVMPGTPLERMWQKRLYTPLTTEEAIDILVKAKRHIPKYCRLMRVQRDIPTVVTLAGVDRTNVRQMIEREMKRQGVVCRCIRCREHRDREISWDSVKLNRETYDSSQGTEIFISMDDMRNELLLGYCRLRIPHKPYRKEITPRTAGIRELHVFGQTASLGEPGTVQHRGLGTTLLSEAERIAREQFDKSKMLVISGVGAREYYRKLGYEPVGLYMGKNI